MADGVMVIAGGCGLCCAGLAGGAGVFRGAKRRGSNPNTEVHITRVKRYMLTIHPARGAPSDALVSAAPLRRSTRLRRASPREDHVHVFLVRPPTTTTVSSSAAGPDTCRAPDDARAEPVHDLPLVNVGGPVGTGHERVHSHSIRGGGGGRRSRHGPVVVAEPRNQVFGAGSIERLPVGRRQSSGLVHYGFQCSAGSRLLPSTVLGCRGGGLYRHTWRS